MACEPHIVGWVAFEWVEGEERAVQTQEAAWALGEAGSAGCV